MTVVNEQNEHEETHQFMSRKYAYILQSEEAIERNILRIKSNFMAKDQKKLSKQMSRQSERPS